MNIRSSIIIPLLLLGLYACNDAEDDQVAQEEQQKTEVIDSIQNYGGYYKHYSGTIADEPVDVNLQQYGNTITGSYYYDKHGVPIALYGSNTPDSNGMYRLEENISEENTNASANYWLFAIEDNSDGSSILTGTWVSGDKKKNYNISLKEDYSIANKFNVVYTSDSMAYDETKESPKAYIENEEVLPSFSADEKGKYVLTLLSQELNCNNISNTDQLINCLKKRDSDFFATYKEDLSGMKDDAFAPRLNYAQSTYRWITYNANDWLVLKNYDYSYMGGAHGNYVSTYKCIDLKNKKVWELGNIMIVDTNKLVNILETDIRNQFGLDKTMPLTDRLLVEKVHIPSTFYITHTGIGFKYDTYEIASYADGEVEVFVPYSKIGDQLTPAFRDRMGLTVAQK